MTKGERRQLEFQNWKQNKGLSDYKFYSSHYGNLTVVHKNSPYMIKVEDNPHELRSVHKVTSRKHAPLTFFGEESGVWSSGERFNSLEELIEQLFIIRLAEL